MVHLGCLEGRPSTPATTIGDPEIQQPKEVPIARKTHLPLGQGLQQHTSFVYGR